jgi:hypothetical protein
MCDYLTAYYAAVCSVKDGDVAQIDLNHTVETDEGTTTLSCSLHREKVDYVAVAQAMTADDDE